MTAPGDAPAPPGAASPGGARGWGGLVTTEVDRLPLGTHGGRDLHARVERRRARLSAGRGWQLSIALGRTRPLAIEVEAAGERYDLPIATADPWFRTARRLGVLAVSAAAILIVSRRRRRSNRAKELPS